MPNNRSKRKSEEEMSMLRCFEMKVESFKNATVQLVDDLVDKREKFLAKQWLEKLFRELLRSGERSADALEYLFFLMCSLQTREPLEHPFTQPPPAIDDRLIPLHYELDTFTYTENLRSLKNDLYLDRYLKKEKEAKSRTKTLLEQSMRPTELNVYPTKKDRAAAATMRAVLQSKSISSPTSAGQLSRERGGVRYEQDDGTSDVDKEVGDEMVDAKSEASGGSKKSKGSRKSGKSSVKSKGSRSSKKSGEKSVKSKSSPSGRRKPAKKGGKKKKAQGPNKK